MQVNVNLGERSYAITIEKGALSHIGSYIPQGGKTLVVTDDGVPAGYAKAVADGMENAVTVTLPQGEATKNFESYKALCEKLLELGFTRSDKVIAVGGGVVGDLAGFAASTYMRGIDFYNVPTTLLSQVDSSVGGKTAIDLCGIKNIIGTFYQPKAVIIDPDVLKTLDRRQYACGMAEALKMAATSSGELFEMIEGGIDERNIEEMIARAVGIKADVVSKDEKEAGLRKILNFGHTIGHGIESLGELYHGECVALGMLCMCSGDVRPRIEKVMKSLGIPTKIKADREKIISAVCHDKKMQGETISAVFVDRIGSFEIRKATPEELSERLSEILI